MLNYFSIDAAPAVDVRSVWRSLEAAMLDLKRSTWFRRVGSGSLKHAGLHQPRESLRGTPRIAVGQAVTLRQPQGVVVTDPSPIRRITPHEGA